MCAARALQAEVSQTRGDSHLIEKFGGRHSYSCLQGELLSLAEVKEVSAG